MPNDAGFVAAPIVGVPGRGQAPVSVGSGTGLGSRLTSAAVRGAQEYIQNPDFRQNVNEAVKTGYGKMRGGNRNSNNSRPRGPRNGGGGRSNVDEFKFPGSSGASSLSSAPNPSPVRLNTPINPNCYVDDFMTPENLKCASMHMNCAMLYIPDTVAAELLVYLNNVAIPRMQLAAQEAVSFNLNVATDFSVANLRNYLRDIVFAHQIYFYYRSIFAYFANPANLNAGMIALKSQVTPAMVEKLSDLGRKLAYMPIPPNLLEMIRYLSANYYSGNTQGSPIIKFCPHLGSNIMIDAADIDLAYNNLDNTTIQRTASLIGRAVKHWIPRDLKDIPTTPLYDPNFTTIFANCPYVAKLLDDVQSEPRVTTDDESIAYCSFTNDLDGAAYALMSVNKGSGIGPIWSPGLIRPKSDYLLESCDTRYSYYEIESVSEFYPSMQYDYLVNTRQDTYSRLALSTSSEISTHLFSTNNVKGVNAGTIRNTAKDVLNYLMSFTDIKPKQMK